MAGTKPKRGGRIQAQAGPQPPAAAPELELETVRLDSLKPHSKNYHYHPDDEIEHIMESVKEHGVYRNIVVAREGTILAGHGVVEAMRRLGIETVSDLCA
jgi:ParB-like chromosome segregation protein Spo0J